MAISQSLRSLRSAASRISSRPRSLSSSAPPHPPPSAEVNQQQQQQQQQRQQQEEPDTASVSQEDAHASQRAPPDSALNDGFIPLEDDSSSKQPGFWTAAKALVAGSLVAGTLASAYVTYG
jgi:hemolysin activation/secretion protein